MVCFILANLKGLLRGLELNLKNKEFDSFGLYQQNKAKYRLNRPSGWSIEGLEVSRELEVGDLEAIRTEKLIVLIKQVINQIHAVWEVNETEFNMIVSKSDKKELFSYNADMLLPLTYISSSYLTTLQGSGLTCVWDWDWMEYPWQWCTITFKSKSEEEY